MSLSLEYGQDWRSRAHGLNALWAYAERVNSTGQGGIECFGENEETTFATGIMSLIGLETP